MDKFRNHLTRASSKVLESYFALNICAANIIACSVRADGVAKALGTYRPIQMLKSEDYCIIYKGLLVILRTFSDVAVTLK
jgi:hypothetical protein